MPPAGIIRPGGECCGHQATSPAAVEPMADAASKDRVNMNAKLATLVLGVSVLIANGANARPSAVSHSHVLHSSQAFGRAYGYAPHEAPQYRSSGGLYHHFRKDISRTRIRIASFT
jgi:hypothetical protein